MQASPEDSALGLSVHCSEPSRRPRLCGKQAQFRRPARAKRLIARSAGQSSGQRVALRLALREAAAAEEPGGRIVSHLVFAGGPTLSHPLLPPCQRRAALEARERGLGLRLAVDVAAVDGIEHIRGVRLVGVGVGVRVRVWVGVGVGVRVGVRVRWRGSCPGPRRSGRR